MCVCVCIYIYVTSNPLRFFLFLRNSLSGHVMWEHPNFSIATGVLHRLREDAALCRARESLEEQARFRAVLNRTVHERAAQKAAQI